MVYCLGSAYKSGTRRGLIFTATWHHSDGAVDLLVEKEATFHRFTVTVTVSVGVRIRLVFTARRNALY